MLYDVAGSLKHKPNKKLSLREQRIYDFMASNCLGVLSSVTADGDPHGAVIYYSAEKDFSVSFITRSQTSKYTNLKRMNHVMLTIYDPKVQAVVQVAGTAEEQKDSETINIIARKVMTIGQQMSDSGLPPVVKLGDSPYVAFTIKPVQVRMASYASPNADGQVEVLDSCESFDLADGQL